MIELLVVLTICNLIVLIVIMYSSTNQKNSTREILSILKEAVDNTILEPPDKFDMKIVEMNKDDTLEDSIDSSAKIVDSRSIWEEDSLTAEEIEQL